VLLNKEADGTVLAFTPQVFSLQKILLPIYSKRNSIYLWVRILIFCQVHMLRTFLARSSVSSLPASALFRTLNTSLFTCSYTRSFSNKFSSFSDKRVSSYKQTGKLM